MECNNLKELIEKILQLKSMIHKLGSIKDNLKDQCFFDQNFFKNYDEELVSKIILSQDDYFTITKVSKLVVQEDIFQNKKDASEIVNFVTDLVFKFIDLGQVSVEGTINTGYKFKVIKEI